MSILDGVDLRDPAECEAFVKRAFAEQPDRLRHVLVIADLVRQSARDINELNPGTNVDESKAYCAALVHDIGYISDAVEVGFHPLDGYYFLKTHGYGDLAQLIVGHSSAPEEAQLRGFSLPDASDNLIARLITYWDVQIKQGGERVSYEQRCRDILLRYGEQSVVGQATIEARPRILEIIEQIDRLSHLVAS